MRKSRCKDGQIAFASRQAETGKPVKEVLRKMGISERTFYRWKRLPRATELRDGHRSPWQARRRSP